MVPVAINETAARTIWPGRNPIGALGGFSGPKGTRFEVVGVVRDVRNNGLNKPPEPAIYFSAGVLAPNPMLFIVRSELPVTQLIPLVRRAIRQAGPTLAITDVMTMNDFVSGTLQLERLSSLVMTFLGLAALLMATLGVYGVMSYYVRQRTVELGTRMALGAVTSDLVNLVLGGGLKLSLAGIGIGSIALGGVVWLLVRLLEVFDIGWPPVAFSTAVVAFVATAAASVPAWRTTLLSPMVAIREQPPSIWRWAHQRVQRAVHDVRDAIGASDTGSDLSPADVLTTFVDAARSAESYTDALHAVLTSVCHELRVESAALLEGDGSPPSVYRCLVSAGTIEPGGLVIPADGFLMSRLRRHALPLPFEAKELTALAEWTADHRPGRLDEIRALGDAGIRLAVPLRTRNETLGVLLLGERQQHASFRANDKLVLRAAADQFALMIENARLTKRVVEQETLRRDIALASDVQRRLLPDAPPRIACADFAAASVPARRIGGDYYDFVELGDGRIGIALADVSGKGVAAALIMSVVQASLRIISSAGNVPPPSLVARMNEFVYRSTPGSKYATFFYAELDQERRQLRYVNAGHNPPYLLRASDGSASVGGPASIEELSVGGTVVGMFPAMAYEEGIVHLHPGDVLLVFTDGVPEAHSPDNEEFGDERLRALLRDVAHLAAHEISARISTEMSRWIRDAEQYDDLTYVVMKVR
jgi:serine phosphatase RsbU (regulator of sigma subunit)